MWSHKRWLLEDRNFHETIPNKHCRKREPLYFPCLLLTQNLILWVDSTDTDFTTFDKIGFVIETKSTGCFKKFDM